MSKIVTLSGLKPFSTIMHKGTSYLALSPMLNENAYLREYLLAPLTRLGPQNKFYKIDKRNEVLLYDAILLEALGLDKNSVYKIELTQLTRLTNLFPEFGLKQASPSQNLAAKLEIQILGTSPKEFEAFEHSVRSRFFRLHGRQHDLGADPTIAHLRTGRAPPIESNALPVRRSARPIAPDPIAAEPVAESAQMVDDVSTPPVIDAPSPAVENPVAPEPDVIRSLEGLAGLLGKMRAELPLATTELMTNALDEIFKQAAENDEHLMTPLFLKGVLAKGFELKAKAANDSPFKLNEITPQQLIDICQQIDNGKISAEIMARDIDMIGVSSARRIQAELPNVMAQLTQKMSFG